MEYKLQDVQGIKDVKYIIAPFDVIVGTFEKNALSLFSAAQFAQKRIESGIDSHLFANGSFVKEGVLYVPNSNHKINLVRKSFVLANPKDAVAVHKRNKEFFVDEAAALEYLEANKRNVLVLNDLSPIPTIRFGEDERTVWLFGKSAQEYGKVLSEKVKKMTFRFDNANYIDKQGKPYADQLWLGLLDYGSFVIGNPRILNCNYTAFGVPSGSAAGATRAKRAVSPTLPYTQKQVKIAISTLQGVREGNLPASKLEKTIIFLESLKK